MNTFALLFLMMLVLNMGIEIVLARRHAKHIRLHQNAVPTFFAEKISLAEHQKAAQYTLTKISFGQKILILEILMVLLWTIGGLLEWLDLRWRMVELPTLWTGVAVMLSMVFINGLIHLPTEIYATFRIESQFGFNRTTPKLFVTDLIKSLILGVFIGVPFLALILWLMESAGKLWWMWVWGVWLGFSLLMTWAYPVFIAPLFNTFEPLAEGALKQRIESLLQRHGFASQGIFIMDGSKRTGHGNAYFTGFGRNKRIVFFDTLIKSLNDEEIEAVLAHEIGHFTHKHLKKRLIGISLFSLMGLALLGWLMQQPWFYEGLGVTLPSTYMALILFNIVAPIFTFFLSPLVAWFSRKHEFEADAFAARETNAQSLILALVKLFKENANTLTPDPLYSAFYDSHPPAPVRIARLSNI